jgi:hypothetical protein
MGTAASTAPEGTTEGSGADKLPAPETETGEEHVERFLAQDDSDPAILEIDKLMCAGADHLLDFLHHVKRGARWAVAAAQDAITPPDDPAQATGGESAPETRTIGALLQTFRLPDEANPTSVVHYDPSPPAAGARDEGGTETSPSGGQAAGATAAPDAGSGVTVPTVPKDVTHASDAQEEFPIWHVDLPSGPYKAPYSVTLAPEKVAKIRKARGLLPVIQHGTWGKAERKPAGWLQYVPDPGSHNAGWIYVEPAGEYQTWVFDKLKKMYADAKANADQAIAATDNKGWTIERQMQERAAERIVSAVRVTDLQEGLPSCINSWDGTVLTWGDGGFAAPGKLPQVFEAISRSADCRKVMYLCGFLYMGVKWDLPAYQVVDVEAGQVLFRNNQYTEDYVDPSTGKRKWKKGDPNFTAYKVLDVFSKQIELMYMLIALARDERTRDTVWSINFNLMAGMCTVVDGAKIASEALYVFVAEAQHEFVIQHRNWCTTLSADKKHRVAYSAIQWAFDHFTAEERSQFRDGQPSLERDVAIAKGIFRYTCKCIEEDHFGLARARLNAALKKQKIDAPALLTEGIDMATSITRYGLHELMKNYWIPMQKGVGPAGVKPHQLGEVTLDVPGFPKKLTKEEAEAAGPDDIVMTTETEGPAKGSWNIGTQDQCDFLMPKGGKLFGYDTRGRIVMREPNGKEWRLEQDKATNAWARVQP